MEGENEVGRRPFWPPPGVWPPPDWCDPGYQTIVEQFLRSLPVSPSDKKQALIAWADCAGVTVTAEKVSRVTGVPAGEV